MNQKTKKNLTVRQKFFIAFGIFVFVILLMNYVLLPLYTSSAEVKVPKILGLNQDEAVRVLLESGLEPVVGGTTYDEKYAEGTVMLQKPNAGKSVKEGRRIYIFISGGKPDIKVPNLKGKSLTDAKIQLEKLGLKLGGVKEVPSMNPPSIIIDQQYAEGTAISKGTYVSVVVSLGEIDTNMVSVPDLIGKSLSEAQQTLSTLNLRVGKINYQSSVSLLPNTVLDQYPSSGSRVDKDSPVDLFITKEVGANGKTEEGEGD